MKVCYVSIFINQRIMLSLSYLLKVYAVVGAFSFICSYRLVTSRLLVPLWVVIWKYKRQQKKKIWTLRKSNTVTVF